MPNAGEVGRQSSGFLREKALRSEEKDSGMKYLIQESKKNKGFVIGPEYQVLDDKQHPDAKLYTTYPEIGRAHV